MRNAILQGRETVEAIRARLQRQAAPPAADELDLVIVGAGPAGLSAALASTEHGLRYVVLEQQESFGGTIYNYPRRKIVHTQPVEMPLHGTLSAAEYSKEELLELFEALVEEHRIPLLFGQRVTDVSRRGGGFVVSTLEGSFRCRTVLLAIGRRGTPRKLGVEGEDLPKVMYEVRDAAEYSGQKILVVGGGDSAVEAAMGLASQPGNQVSLSYRKARFGRIKKKNLEKLEEAVKAESLETIYDSNLKRIDEGSVELTQGERSMVLENDYVFVFAGSLPPYPFLEKIGVQFGGSS